MKRLLGQALDFCCDLAEASKARASEDPCRSLFQHESVQCVNFAPNAGISRIEMTLAGPDHRGVSHIPCLALLMLKLSSINPTGERNDWPRVDVAGVGDHW